MVWTLLFFKGKTTAEPFHNAGEGSAGYGNVGYGRDMIMFQGKNHYGTSPPHGRRKRWYRNGIPANVDYGRDMVIFQRTNHRRTSPPRGEGNGAGMPGTVSYGRDVVIFQGETHRGTFPGNVGYANDMLIVVLWL